MHIGQATQTGDPSAYEKLLEFLYLTPVGIIDFQPCGTIRMANPAAMQLLLPLAQAADLTNIFAALQSLAPDLRDLIASFAEETGQVCDQMQLRVPGSRTVLALGVNKISPSCLMAVMQDISRAIEQEARLRDDTLRLDAILDNIRDCAIYMTDTDGRVERWNRSLNRVGGWEPGDVTGAPIDMFLSRSADDAVTVAALLNRARQDGSAELEGRVYRKDGSAFWGVTVATALPNGFGRAKGFVLVTRDRTESKLKEDRLLTLATTDPLTGALNRRAGEAGLADAFLDWTIHSRMFGVAMVDIDHFKSVNDTWGHDFGDAVLVSLTNVFREKLRQKDLVVRWGGEEFLLLLTNGNREVAQTVAERVCSAIGRMDFVHGDERVKVTASIGIAVASSGDEGFDDVVKRADTALYAAKRGGRNRIVSG